MYRVLVPSEPSELIPKGAALLQLRRGEGVVYLARGDSFAECCANARTRGRVVAIPEDAVEVGIFEEGDGELRLGHGSGVAALERWLGHRVYRNDLEARDNRSDRRARARRLTMQGRTAEAFLIDRRLGL
jgi:hypothetical protein